MNPKLPPTLLMGIDEAPTTAAGMSENHIWVVADLEKILSDDGEESSFSEGSMSESNDEDEDMDTTEEVEDSTTLSKFQEGIRKETLAKKGGSLPSASQKKGRIGESDDGDPIRISRSHSSSA